MLALLHDVTSYMQSLFKRKDLTSFQMANTFKYSPQAVPGLAASEKDWQQPATHRAPGDWVHTP